MFSLLVSFPLGKIKHIASRTVSLNFLSLLGNESVALCLTYVLDF